MKNDKPATPSRVRASWTSAWWVSAAVCGLAYLALAVLDARNGTLRASVTPTTIGWILVAFVGFAFGIRSNERKPIPLTALWLLAIVFRLTLATTEPTLSDDVHRYLWDGHLVAVGVNPYDYAIAAPELDRYEIPARRLANNPELSSPYLPAAHGLFAVVTTLLPPTPTSMQLAMIGLDLAAAFVISRLLALAGLPRHRLMLYLWNPLVIVELAHGAHLDAAMVFLALLSIWAALATLRPARRSLGQPMKRIIGAGSAFALALAILTRPIPVLLAPVLWWRWNWWERLTVPLVVVLAILPFSRGRGGLGLGDEQQGFGVFGSARVYGQDFRFNSGINHWLEAGLGTRATGIVVAALMAALLFWVWLAARRTRALEPAAAARRLLRLLALPLGAYVILTPVFHPWYLVALLALVPFIAPGLGECGDRWLLIVPWGYLAAASSLSYLTYRDPDRFGELEWVRAVEWYPTLALLVATSFWVFFAVQAEPPTLVGSAAPNQTDASQKESQPDEDEPAVSAPSGSS